MPAKAPTEPKKGEIWQTKNKFWPVVVVIDQLTSTLGGLRDFRTIAITGNMKGEIGYFNRQDLKKRVPMPKSLLAAAAKVK